MGSWVPSTPTSASTMSDVQSPPPVWLPAVRSRLCLWNKGCLRTQHIQRKSRLSPRLCLQLIAPSPLIPSPGPGLAGLPLARQCSPESSQAHLSPPTPLHCHCSGNPPPSPAPDGTSPVCLPCRSKAGHTDPRLSEQSAPSKVSLWPGAVVHTCKLSA